jgi:hypothetical protein
MAATGRMPGYIVFVPGKAMTGADMSRTLNFPFSRTAIMNSYGKWRPNTGTRQKDDIEIVSKYRDIHAAEHLITSEI